MAKTPLPVVDARLRCPEGMSEDVEARFYELEGAFGRGHYSESDVEALLALAVLSLEIRIAAEVGDSDTVIKLTEPLARLRRSLSCQPTQTQTRQQIRMKAEHGARPKSKATAPKPEDDATSWRNRGQTRH